LPASAGSLVSAVVGSVAAAGRGVAVGCASGGDAAVLSALCSGRVFVPFAVFAAFGVGGVGAGRFSAVPLVARAASLSSCAGGSVRWVRFWAGGGPSVPLVARLRARSAALVSFVASSGPGAGVVAFLSSPLSRGSVRSLRLAVRAGLPVVAFPVGFPARLLPRFGSGRWVVAGRGVWARGWRWVPGGASASSGALLSRGGPHGASEAKSQQFVA